MAAQISPKPIPVASQLLTPSKSGVSSSEPQKSTFQSELNNVASSTQSNDKVSVNNTEKNTNKVTKNQEVVEKSDSESMVSKNDSGVDDSVNSSSISAADTNSARNKEQQSQNVDGQKTVQITENEETRAVSSVLLTDVNEGNKLPETGARLPLEPERTKNAELENRSLSTNELLPSISTAQASALSRADANLTAEQSLSEQRVLAGQAATGSDVIQTLTSKPLTDSQLKANISVENAAVSNVRVAQSAPLAANELIVGDDVKRAVATEQSGAPKADVSAMNVAAQQKPVANVLSEAEFSKLEGQLSNQQLNKAPINEGLIANNQSVDKVAQTDNNATRPESLVIDSRQQRPTVNASSAQESAPQITANIQIGEPKQSGLVQQSDPALNKVQTPQNNADISGNAAGQNQINSKGFENSLVFNDNTPALNVAKDAALTMPPQAAVQTANINQEKLKQQQNVSRDFKLDAANAIVLSSSEQAGAKEVVKTNIVGDAKVQINQPAPLPMPVNTTPLTDNQTFALNQSLEKLRSGIDINAQADEASTVKSNVDKALVANEAVQQLSHLQNNLKTASPVQLQMPVATPPTAKNWGNAVADKVLIAASQNLRVASIQLDPPELGALQVRLHVTGPDQQMTVSFTSPHASVRDALEQNLPRLREMLEEQGINLGESSVNDQGKDDSNGGANGQHSSLYADQDDAASINPLNTQGSLALVDFYA